MLLGRIRRCIESVLASGSAGGRPPVLRRGHESSVRGLHISGDRAGAPVLKLAMVQGVVVVEHLATPPEMRAPADPDTLDLPVVGAGAAGLSAALAARDRGWRCVLVEHGRLAHTIADFPDGKWIQPGWLANPPDSPLSGQTAASPTWVGGLLSLAVAVGRGDPPGARRRGGLSPLAVGARLRRRIRPRGAK